MSSINREHQLHYGPPTRTTGKKEEMDGGTGVGRRVKLTTNVFGYPTDVTGCTRHRPFADIDL